MQFVIDKLSTSTNDGFLLTPFNQMGKSITRKIFEPNEYYEVVYYYSIKTSEPTIRYSGGNVPSAILLPVVVKTNANPRLPFRPSIIIIVRFLWTPLPSSFIKVLQVTNLCQRNPCLSRAQLWSSLRFPPRCWKYFKTLFLWLPGWSRKGLFCS